MHVLSHLLSSLSDQKVIHKQLLLIIKVNILLEGTYIIKCNSYLNDRIDRRTAIIVLLHDLATNLKRHIKVSIINRRILLLVLAENIAKCDISLDDRNNSIQLLHFRSKTNQNVISTL